MPRCKLDKLDDGRWMSAISQWTTANKFRFVVLEQVTNLTTPKHLCKNILRTYALTQIRASCPICMGIIWLIDFGVRDKVVPYYINPSMNHQSCQRHPAIRDGGWRCSHRDPDDGGRVPAAGRDSEEAQEAEEVRDVRWAVERRRRVRLYCDRLRRRQREAEDRVDS